MFQSKFVYNVQSSRVKTTSLTPPVQAQSSNVHGRASLWQWQRGFVCASCIVFCAGGRGFYVEVEVELRRQGHRPIHRKTFEVGVAFCLNIQQGRSGFVPSQAKIVLESTRSAPRCFPTSFPCRTRKPYVYKASCTRWHTRNMFFSADRPADRHGTHGHKLAWAQTDMGTN